MFCISINANGVVWSFLYRTEEAAVSAYETVLTPDQFAAHVQIRDDYGQIGRFQAKEISSALLEDFEVSRVAHVERTIHATKIQLEAQKRMHSDPSVRAASPAVFTPGMSGNGLIR